MMAGRRASAAPTVWVTLVLSMLSSVVARAAVHTVKQDGAGAFTTIQACANAARAGDTCLVFAGDYDEHVRTTASGLSDDSRIVFRANGTVTMKGFDILHAYVTVDGFNMTGYAVNWGSYVQVGTAGHYCEIVNNYIHEDANHAVYNGEPRVAGIRFLSSGASAAGHCLVRGNRISNLIYIFLTTRGDSHLIEHNTFEYANSWDYLNVFGSNLVFRRNVLVRGTTMVNAGNHFDVLGIFGDGGGGYNNAENILFEENWMEGIQAAFCQLTSSDIRLGALYDNIKNITFRRNIIANIDSGGSILVPGVRFEHNTLYRVAYAANGMAYSGSLTRGDFFNGALRSNVLLAGGLNPQLANGELGFYDVPGARFNREVIGVHVTNDPSALGDNAGNATTQGVAQSLLTSGYIANLDGWLTAKALALSNISEFEFVPAYDAYKLATYDHLVATATMHKNGRATFAADYNYVAGSAAGGYPAKKTGGCVPGQTSTTWNFCEAHGVNGGDPRLRDTSNLLGPDGLPFTLDDGLKPLPTSPLCGRGDGGSDIGAYSCDPTKVFSTDGLRPSAPTNVTVR